MEKELEASRKIRAFQTSFDLHQGFVAAYLSSRNAKALHGLFVEKYAPDVSVFTDGKVEIMFKLTYEQAQNLAKLMKQQDLS